MSVFDLLHTNRKPLDDGYLLRLRTKPEDRQGTVYKIKCCDWKATCIGETGRNLTTRLTEHKRATGNDVNNYIAEHHLQTKHQIATGTLRHVLRILQTTINESLSVESWFTNLEQTPLNRCQQLPAPYKHLMVTNYKRTREWLDNWQFMVTNYKRTREWLDNWQFD